MGFFSGLWNGIKKVGGAIGSALTGNPLGTIASAVDIGKSIFGSNSAAKEQKAQNEFNSVEAQKNRDFQQQMLEYQNNWQSPVEQMKRYQEAGLNPNLVYSQMQGAASSGVSGGQAQSVGMSGRQALALSHFNIAEKMKQIQLMDAQANDLNASADLKRSQKPNVEEDTGYKQRQNKMFDATYSANVVKAFKQIDVLNNTIEGQKLQNQLQKWINDFQLSHTTEYDQLLSQKVELNNWTFKQMDATIEKLMADAEYVRECKKYVHYNAVTGRISANAAAMNAEAYAYIAPYLANMYYEQARHFGAQADLKPFQIMQLLAASYSLYAKGNLDLSSIQKVASEIGLIDRQSIGQDIKNRRNEHTGAEEPGSGYTGPLFWLFKGIIDVFNSNNWPTFFDDSNLKNY